MTGIRQGPWSRVVRPACCALAIQLAPACASAPGHEPREFGPTAWDFVEHWRTRIPGSLEGWAFAGAPAGDLTNDGVGEIALVLPAQDAPRLVLVSGASGKLLEGPTGVPAPGSTPGSFSDPAIAVAADAASPDRSLLLIGLPYAADRRGVVIALDLSTRERRYAVEGKAGDCLGAAIAPGPDFDGDGWPDYAVLAKGQSGEEGEAVTPSFVSMRSGRTGAEIVAVGTDPRAIGATLPLRLEAQDRHLLLVASWLSFPTDGTADGPPQTDRYSGGTLLTAYSIPSGEVDWAAWIENFGLPSLVSQPWSSLGIGGDSLLLGVPYRGRFNSFDDWFEDPGQVLLVSSQDGQLQRSFEGTLRGDRFGRSAIGLPDLTGDGVFEIGISLAQIDRRRAPGGPALKLLDGATGQPIALAGHDSPGEEWGSVLVATSAKASDTRVVASVVEAGAGGWIELRGFRLEPQEDLALADE